MTNRYFKVDETLYENVRSQMDTESGYPNDQAETWFTPASEQTRNDGGLLLIACIQPIAERFVDSGAVELTKDQFAAEQIFDSANI